MHFYLEPFTNVSADPDNAFNLTGSTGFPNSYFIDLRPDQTVKDGYGLLCVETRDDTAVKDGFYLGSDTDFDRKAQAVRTLFSSKLSATIASDTLRGVIAEYMTSGRIPYFKPVNGRWQQIIGGLSVFNVPVITGGSGPFVDSFDRADNATMGAFSDGSGVNWVEAVSGWSIDTNTAAFSTAQTAAFDICHIDTDLASDDHYAQCAVENLDNSANTQGGVILRKDGTATYTFYLARIGQVGDFVNFRKVVSGTPTNLATAAFTNVASVFYTLYAEFNSSDQYTVKIDGTTKLGPTTETAITGKFRTGLCGINVASGTVGERWNDFTTADLGGAVTVLIPGFAGGLVMDNGTLSPYRLIV